MYLSVSYYTITPAKEMLSEYEKSVWIDTILRETISLVDTYGRVDSRAF